MDSGQQSEDCSFAASGEASGLASGDQTPLPPLPLPPLPLPDEDAEAKQTGADTLATRLDEVARGLEKLKEENVRKRALIEGFRRRTDRLDKAIAEVKAQLKELEEEATKQEAAAGGASDADKIFGGAATSSSPATPSSSPTPVPAAMVTSQMDACPAEAPAATPAEEEESDRPLDITDRIEAGPSE